MDMFERWKTDEGQEIARPLTAVESVRTRQQAREHLKEIGVDIQRFDNNDDVSPQRLADALAAEKGFVYPNYRPK